MFKRWFRTKRREFLRDRILGVGRLLDEFSRDRAAITYDAWPEECDRLDALIDKYTRRQESLLTQFKEA